MRSRISAGVVTFILAFATAACGTNGDEEGAATDTGTQAATRSPTVAEGASGAPPVELEGQVNAHGTGTVSSGRIELELDNFYFEPTFVQADPGTTVEVEAFNEGSTGHTFTIQDQDVDLVLEPDQRQTVEVVIPDSGTLQFICRFHEAQGMKGAFFTG